MDKDKLLARLKLLESERDQVKASMSAYEGAIQDCNYWLQQLDEQSTAEPIKEENV